MSLPDALKSCRRFRSHAGASNMISHPPPPVISNSNTPLLDFRSASPFKLILAALPTPHGDEHALWIDPADNQRMARGNDGGACISFNSGRIWSSIYNQPTAQLYHVCWPIATARKEQPMI